MPTKALPKFTIAVIAICVLVAIGTKLGQPIAERFPLLSPLYFSLHTQLFAPEIQAGEYWRLVTPIFIHFSIFHIGFNCATMYMLGSIVELIKGPWSLALLTLIAGVISNTVQYLAEGPGFGGLSGVVYAVFGWLWMQSLFNHTIRLELPRQFIVIMLVWFVLCWLGLIGAIANWAHTAGLLTGVIAGFSGAQIDNLRVARELRRINRPK